jgi:hypothetical protein
MIRPSMVNLSSKTIHVSAAMAAPINRFNIAAIVKPIDETNRVLGS